MSALPQPLTRNGLQPNRAGREGVAASMSRLLDEGRAYCEPDADIDVDALRAWAMRLGGLASDLADCVEAPVRNRVMETLCSPSVPDDAPALLALRINVAGESARGLSREIDVAAPTIERVENGAGCQVRVAKAIADRFALRVSELFDHRGTGDSLTCRSVGELRDVLLGAADSPE
jgi:DNA-binding XRE family transcriptional regulator